MTTRPIALTMGDPAGIGPEITAKAWSELRSNSDYSFFVTGDISLYETVLSKASLPAPHEITNSTDEVHSIFPNRLPVLNTGSLKDIEIGCPNSKHAAAIIKSIETAVSLSLKGDAAAVVTCPIAKDNLYKAGFEFPGHTEFLGKLCEGHPVPYNKGPVMLLDGGGLRCALLTIHKPLSDIIADITPISISQIARTLYGALEVDYGLTAPHIAMAGLNPHAGENGALGMEEIEIQNPTAEALRSEGIDISDARPADTLFHAEARANYDAVLAMYHDQGLIPVKTLDFHGGVNITLGLPIIRTSPDHGTAFDIAGQGIARADSLIAAIKKARFLAHNRAQYVG
ncbi:MAG: 4-hydroxythreonine-4-phosphate dehydrogenase PdxA [Maricaulaceae bacterium]